MLPEAPHILELIAVDCVDHHPCPQEEQCLEKGMCEQMELGCGEPESVFSAMPRHAQCKHHEADLRHCGVCQYAFDIRLCTGNDGGEQCGESPRVTDPFEECRCRVCKSREKPGHEEYPGDHHGCGMDERRHGRGAFHRIRQPNVQGEHRALAGAPDEHQRQPPAHCGTTQECLRKECAVYRFVRGCEPVDERLEVKCLCTMRKNQDPNEKSKVGKSGDDECFPGSGNGGGLRIVKSDQQERRYADKFPEDIHLEQVGGHHQSKHREGE